MRLGNCISLAERVGQANNQMFGKQVLRGAQVSFILANIDPPDFTEGPPVRIRQHYMVEASAGTAKSYALFNLFLKRICQAGSIYEAREKQAWGRVKYLEVDSQSWEKIRGSFTTKGDLVFPLLKKGQAITFFSDFPQWLKKSDAGDKIISLGKAMEDRRVLVDLIKGSELCVDAASALGEKLEALSVDGFTYDEETRGFYYDVDQTFWFCTVHIDELDKKLSEFLSTNGFYSRCDRCIVELSNQEEEDYLREEFGSSLGDDEQRLRAINNMLVQTKFEKVPHPPSKLFRLANDWYVDQMLKIREETQIPLLKFTSLRDKARVARLMLASAVARIFENRELDDTRPVKTITYSEADARFAISYLTPWVNYLHSNLTQKTDHASVEAKGVAAEALEAYLKANRDCGGIVDRSSFIEFVSEKLKKNEKTAKNYLPMLQSSGLLTKGRTNAGALYADDGLLRKCGVQSEDEMMAMDPHLLIEKPWE